ncbi:MAG: T9SS type A sorting domain-containing protein [Chitinophagales bacterium]|nr:T9SS type A sorting domain-containing protein [Chitinophagales bacterium]
MNKFLLSLLCIAALSFQAFSQVTLDDFNDGMTTGWVGVTGANTYTLTEANGEMLIDYVNTAPNQFPRATYTIQGGPVDMTDNSILRVAIRTQNLSGTVNVRFDLLDSAGTATNFSPFSLDPLFDNGAYSVYEFDFTGKWFQSFPGFATVDRTVISHVEMFVNFDQAPAGNDSLWIDYMEVDSVTTICQGVVASNDTLDDMECQQNTTYTFANSNWFLKANPDPSGINQSPVVREFLRWPTGDGAFGGSFDVAPLDFTTNNQLKMHFWNDNAPVDILVILQNSAGGDLALEAATALGTGQWEVINFDFSRLTDSTDIARVVYLIDPAIPPNQPDSIYYVDNIVMNGFVDYPCDNAVTDVTIFDDVECQQNVSYSFNNAAWDRINNPDPSGNASTHVRKYIRFPGQDGAVGGPFDNAPVDLSDNSEITMDFWNNNADVSVTMILQDGAGADIDVQVQTASGTASWQTLTFDFSTAAGSNDIQSMVLVVGDTFATNNTYFIDNIQLKQATGINDNEIAYDSELFPNPSTEVTQLSLNIMETDMLNISLFSIDGRKIATIMDSQIINPGVHSFDISVKDIPEGLYFVEIAGSKGKVAKKFIKTN